MAQADTIIPPGVQGLDRYAYVNNSPMNFVDPTGHKPQCDGDGWCGDQNSEYNGGDADLPDGINSGDDQTDSNSPSLDELIDICDSGTGATMGCYIDSSTGEVDIWMHDEHHKFNLSDLKGTNDLLTLLSFASNANKFTDLQLEMIVDLNLVVWGGVGTAVSGLMVIVIDPIDVATMGIKQLGEVVVLGASVIVTGVGVVQLGIDTYYAYEAYTNGSVQFDYLKNIVDKEI
jgi:hypothetical protein